MSKDAKPHDPGRQHKVAIRGRLPRYPNYNQTIDAALATGGDAVSWKENVCFLQRQGAEEWKASECVRTHGATGNAILWGDSFAAHYVPGLVANQDKLTRNIVQYTYAGCPPNLSYKSYALRGCNDFNHHIFDVVEQFHADIVIMSSRWDMLQTRGFEGIRETIQALEDKGVRVYVIGQSPTFVFSAAYLAFRQAGVRSDGSAAWENSTGPEVNRIVAAAAGASYVDPLSDVCKGRLCDYRRAGSLLYSDYGHLSPVGSSLAVQDYFPLFTPQGRVSTQ